ncbi:MAG: hypothetical protein K0Q49_1577 [Haloplasmataceae bacterium]|jgi:predicted esterase|nr:hypothetical protein [Haloplasmataceae bacterium]
MFKNVLTFILLMVLVSILAACSTKNTTNTTELTTTGTTTQVIDTIPPAYVGGITDLEHIKGVQIDLLQGINVIDNVPNKAIELSVIENGGYNKDVSGVYTLVIEAKDSAGNTKTINRKVTVLNTMTKTISAVVMGDSYAEYEMNSMTALTYTSGGTAFKKYDTIQVMTKDFFVEQFNLNKANHTNNGGVPYLSNGVVVIVDNNLNTKHVRIASGISVEMNGEGVVKTSNLSWTNSIDVVNGGGNFKGIVETLESVIPDGGFILFTASAEEQNSKRFFIQNLFYSDYTSGTIATSQFDVDYANITLEIDEDYQEVLIVRPGDTPNPVNGIIKQDMVLEGIPFTVYYKNDGLPKSIIYFFHGFSGDRNSGIMGRGEDLAKMGYYVVAMDAYLHGDREPVFFDQLSYAEKQRDIVNIQIRTAEDAKHLFDKYFKNWDGINKDKVYAYGVSMGAGVTFYLATIMDELKTFASIVGSPSFYEFYQYKKEQYRFPDDERYYLNLNSYIEKDPLINHERLLGKNIFMGNGSTDTTVPLVYAKELAETLNSPNVFFKIYETGHSSTPQMQEDSYEFLLNH